MNYCFIMSQGQPRRPQEPEQESVKYGDIFQVSSNLASKPVAVRDAAAAQAAETTVLGRTQKGGPAATMQSAADVNVSRGVLGRDNVPSVTSEHGVSVTTTDVGGRSVVTESIAGEIVGKYVVTGKERTHTATMTIGRALESVALSAAGEKPVDESDAAAIQAAETRATGRSEVIPGGVASQAQSAAMHNACTMDEGKKIKLRDVLAGASTKLPDDKAVTKEDADRVVGAEIRNKLDMTTYTGGVAEAIVAAARVNQQQK